MKSTLNKLLFFILCFSLAHPLKAQSIERVQILPFKYDDVWRGLLIALSKYPLKKNNQEIGLIETDIIKGDSVWSPPHKKIDSNLRYKLIFRVYDGKAKKRHATKVTVSKTAYLKNDFVGDKKEIESDGFEEIALIYRAKREVIVNKYADRKFNAPKKVKKRIRSRNQRR